MKKFLSLMLSILLVLSSGAGTVFASTDEKTMIEKTKYTTDTTTVQSYTASTGDFTGTQALYLDGIRQNWIYIPHNGSKVKTYTVSTNTEDFETPVLQLDCDSGSYFQIMHDAVIKSSSGITTNSVTGKRAVVEGKVYTTAKNNTSTYWTVNSTTYKLSLPEALKANVWYDFEWELLFGDKFTIRYTEILPEGSSEEAHVVTKSITGPDKLNYIRIWTPCTAGNTLYLDDVKLYVEDVPFEKANIVSVGSDGVVEYGQNVITAELSQKIPELTKDHVTVTNKETGKEVSVSNISVDDASNTLTVSLNSNLVSWSEYDITIDALAFGQGVLQRVGNEEPVPVTNLTADFETTKAPFATKGFEFSSTVDSLSAGGRVVNTSGTAKDIKLVFSATDAEGRQGVLEVENYPAFNSAEGEYLEASIGTAGAEKFSFFIIDNWADKTPLLGVNTVVDADGNATSALDVVACTSLGGDEPIIIANDFNHDNKELLFSVDTKTNAAVKGLIFVYKKGEDVSDENLPVYACVVETSEDGTMKACIPLSESLEYGEYVVEFASEAISENITDDFKFYTPEELIDGKKEEIFEAAKAALTAAELKEIVLGLNSSDEKVNSNFDIFGADADMSDYEAVLDTEKIFKDMLSSMADVDGYDALVSLFEECAKNQHQYEVENPTIIIESALTTVADTTQTIKYGTTTGNYSGTQALTTDSAKNHWLYITSNSNKQETYEITNDTSFGGSVAKFKNIYDTYIEFFFGGTIPSGKELVRNILKNEKGTFEGEIRFTQDVTPTWTMSPTGGIASKSSLGSKLKADTWYNFKWDVVTGSHIKVSFVEKLSEEDVAAGVTPHSVSKQWNYTSGTFTYFRFFPGIAVGEAFYLDNVKMYYDLIPYEKAKVESIGTNGVVEYGQNSFAMTLSQEIPGLTKDHVSVVNKETGETIGASAISADSTTHTVNVTLESNLMGWSEYEVKIDKAAFGADVLERVGKNDPVPVTDIVSGFETTKASLAAKSFAFTGSAENLNAKSLVANTSGTPTDMNFVFASFDANGRIVNVSSTEHAGFNNADGEYLEASTSTDGAKSFNFFVIDNWTNRNHLFASYYNVDADGEYISGADAVSGGVIGTNGASVELGEFDYENIKISLKADTKSGKLEDGIIFVYKNNEDISASNLPVYAKAVSTSADGTVEYKLILPANLAYGEYTVEFKVSGVSLKENFNYYTPDELIALRKAEIVSQIKSCTTTEELKEIILGVDSSGTPLNDNYDFICESADKVNYEKVEDADKVFEKVLSAASSLSDYNSFITLFNNSVKEVRDIEISNQRLVICSEVKSSRSYGALRMVILGINEKGETVNYNFEIISADANMTNYNKLKSKDKVFTKMYSKLSQVTDYDSLIELFEKCAKEQYNDESESKSSPSSNNKGYGGSSVAVKETVDNPVISAPESGNASASGGRFADMKSHWAESYVNELAERGIMNGYNDGSFRGENGITRAELAKTLVEALEISGSGEVSYSDVASDSWYASYVARAALAGIVKGYEDGSFAPDVQVTRQDAALMLYRAMSVGRTLPLGYTFFTDDLDIDNYASGAIRTLGDLGIVNGDANKAFNPKNTITRAEVATIICRALDYIESH